MFLFLRKGNRNFATSTNQKLIVSTFCLNVLTHHIMYGPACIMVSFLFWWVYSINMYDYNFYTEYAAFFIDWRV